MEILTEQTCDEALALYNQAIEQGEMRYLPLSKESW